MVTRMNSKKSNTYLCISTTMLHKQGIYYIWRWIAKLIHIMTIMFANKNEIFCEKNIFRMILKLMVIIESIYNNVSRHWNVTPHVNCIECHVNRLKQERLLFGYDHSNDIFLWKTYMYSVRKEITFGEQM